MSGVPGDPAAMAISRKLPGGLVAQRGNRDCFTACISMLTGIDMDLLPVHPPISEVYRRDNEVHIVPQWQGLSDWNMMLQDNGFSLYVPFGDKHIDGPHIGAFYDDTWNGMHAMVIIEDTIVNPGDGLGTVQVLPIEWVQSYILAMRVIVRPL